MAEKRETGRARLGEEDSETPNPREGEIGQRRGHCPKSQGPGRPWPEKIFLTRAEDKRAVAAAEA